MPLGLAKFLDTCQRIAEGAPVVSAVHYYSLGTRIVQTRPVSATLESFFDELIEEVMEYSVYRRIHLTPLGVKVPVCGRTMGTYTIGCLYPEVFDMAYRKDHSQYFCKRCMKSWDLMGRSLEDSAKGGMIVLQGMMK